jgi:DNA-binding transcriptional LysR family regulator
MSVSRYEALISTAELGSLTKAADALGYTQSGITHLLDALERQLGVRLLNRSRSGASLTSDGQVLLPYVRAVVNQQRLLDEQVSRLKGLTEGLIRVGTFTSVSAHWLPGMIAAFQGDHPGVRFELVHGTNAENEARVRDGSVDVAFVRLPAASDLESFFLVHDPIVGVVPAQGELALPSPLRLADLAELPYIQLSEGVDDEISELLRTARIRPDTRFVEQDDYAVIAMVEQGLGVSVMPQLVVKGTARDVRIVPLEPAGSRDLGIACRSDEALSVAARAFVRCAEAWVGDWCD